MACSPYYFNRPRTVDPCDVEWRHCHESGPTGCTGGTGATGGICHECDPSWGSIYEGVEYPLIFLLNGAGCVNQWTIKPRLDSTDPVVRLTDEGAPNIGYFTLTRVSGSSALPIENYELVTVSVNILHDTAIRQLYWNKFVLTRITCVTLSWEPDVIFGTTQSAKFAFTSTKRCCDVHIGLSPAVPGLDLHTLASLCTETRTTEPVSISHAIVWPNYADATPLTTKLYIGTAFGEWVWNPSAPVADPYPYDVCGIDVNDYAEEECEVTYKPRYRRGYGRD